MFKIGDKVKCIDSHPSWSIKEGRIYMICAVNEEPISGQYVDVDGHVDPEYPCNYPCESFVLHVKKKRMKKYKNFVDRLKTLE